MKRIQYSQYITKTQQNIRMQKRIFTGGLDGVRNKTKYLEIFE